MARPGLVPQAIVLALGAGALGGPDALRLLLQFAGRSSPAVDLAFCVVVIGLLIVPVLGTLLLARFVRKARAGARGGAAAAPATDLFARVTATVSVGAAFLVTACLLVVPEGGGGQGGAVRLPIDFAVKNPIVVTVLAICVVVMNLVTAPLFGAMLLARFVRKARRAGGGSGGAPATGLFAQVTAAVSVGAALLVTACLLVVPGGVGAVSLPIDFAVKNLVVVTVLVVGAAFAFAATGSLPCAVHLRARFFRGPGSAGAPATEIKIVFLVAVSLVVAAFVASSGYNWRRSMVTMPVGVAVAIVTVAATTLVVKCSRSVRSAAGAGGGGAAARVQADA